MAISKRFQDFINEASLKGNIGVPGEGGTEGSWLENINREQREKVSDFERTNMGLLRNFGGIIEDSKRLQRGKEKELSELCQKAFYKLFGTLLDDVILDLKIGTEARQMMGGTPEKPQIPNLERIVDERVLNEIMKRKILRTIQQGKGLNSKSLLNLPLFKDGIKEILGERTAQQYIDNLNNIVKVMAFFDATLSEAQITQALKMNAQGACDIKVEEEEKDKEKDKEKEKDAEQLLKDLENGIDLSETESDILSNVKSKIVARGVDMGILIHESLKGIYKLETQMSLEHLPEEIAKQVLQNTDTISDEPQEFKYGPAMQKQFESVINTHPKVKSIIDNLTSDVLRGEKSEISEAENQLAAFQEQLFFYVFGYLAALGKDDPKEMLKVVYSVLANKKEDIERLFFPIVGSSVASIEQEFKYQQSKTQQKEISKDGEPKVEPTAEPKVEFTLAELQEELDDAVDNEDYERASQIRDEIKKRFPENK